MRGQSQRGSSGGAKWLLTLQIAPVTAAAINWTMLKTGNLVLYRCCLVPACTVHRTYSPKWLRNITEKLLAMP